MASRWAVVAAMMGAALLSGTGRAWAACSLNTMDVPVTMEGRRPVVAGKINGHPVKLMLDSGSFFNSLDAKFAADQKLKPVTVERLGSRFPAAAKSLVVGLGGETAAGIVIAPAFEFASAKFENVAFLTYNFGAPTGLLGQNFLHQVDDEYDLKDGLMRLVRPEGCDTAELAYWAKPGMTYSVAPLVFTDRHNAHTVVAITINGVKMRAEFDTGSPSSFITERAAARAGVKTTDPGVEPAGHTHGLDQTDIKTWVGRFASVKVGDEEIKNGLLTIGDTDVDDFDVLLGADFFLAHHLYVANSQGKLYFTYSGGPVFDVPAHGPAAAGGQTPPAKSP